MKCSITEFTSSASGELSEQFIHERLTKTHVVSFPVVPKGKARIRVQLSAAHTTEEIEQAIKAFTEVGRKLKVIK